ncbi:MAG: hypothetical protein H6R13_857 [Proteobacteria bacterium]|nr:hypothetical protein [Pseudomonadota bacterium]
MTVSRPKILAIDDTPENLVLLATALEKEFDFQLAASGAAGLVLAEASPPDLILLDVMMPQMDGFETCRRLKANPVLAAIPVIFITALSDVESEVTGLKEGGADFITKPIRIELVRQRIRNILKLTQLSLELQRSEQRLSLVMEVTGDGIWDWEVATGKVIHNAMWCHILGLSPDYLEHSLGKYSERIHPEHAEGVRAALDAAFIGVDYYTCEYQIQHAEGHYVWVSDHGKVVQRDAYGAPVRLVGSIRNIDERKRNEAEIHQLAFYDTLTELPNRRLMNDRLQQALFKSARSKLVGAVMFIDMDRFKELNDTHGHAMGDLLLQEVAHRLKLCVRQQDTVARLGGDEFIVLLEGLSASSSQALINAQVVSSKLLRSLNEPYQLGELSYHSTPSVGLTMFSGDGDTIDEILKRADVAMYQSKAAGRNRVSVYGDTGNAEAV